MTTEPIRDVNKLKALAEYWLERGNYRNNALIVVGVCTALRIGDLLKLKWEDVYDESAKTFHSHITLTEQKTKKRKVIALNEQAVQALLRLLPHRRGKYIFSNNRKNANAISRTQAWRIIKKAVEAIKLIGVIACHSLRKTMGYLAWKAGTLPVLLMDIFNHASFEITRRYLGISQDDRDGVYMGLAVF